MLMIGVIYWYSYIGQSQECRSINNCAEGSIAAIFVMHRYAFGLGSASNVHPIGKADKKKLMPD